MIPSILPTYARAKLSFTQGQGAWLTEHDGRRFLDFGAGIAVNALGHAHPQLIEALTQQAQTLWHTSNLYHIPAQEELADKLVKMTFADTCFITNSGTESCELAVKMARKYWSDKGKPNRKTIITLEGAFHGRSSAGIAASGSDKMTSGFEPILPGFISIPFGDLEALKNSLGDSVAAIMVEPIQGEGGIRSLSQSYLKALREHCSATGTLLIFDEIQCGVARTGQLFAHEWADVSPDIMMIAKGIGGGFPIGAVVATQDAASGMTLGTHGSTYGGNPLGCAVANTVLDIVGGQSFLDGVSAKAQTLTQGLEGIVSRYPSLFEGWRGRGLMIGLKCLCPNMDVITAAYEQELLLVPASDNIVRLLPPLNITDDDITTALDKLERAAQKIANGATS